MMTGPTKSSSVIRSKKYSVTQPLSPALLESSCQEGNYHGHTEHLGHQAGGHEVRPYTKRKPPNDLTPCTCTREHSNFRTFERFYSLRSGRLRARANQALAAFRLK